MTEPTRRPLLLVVRDVFGAGLLGALADAEGYAPSFPRVGERPEQTVVRVRPAVVLLDAHHPAARRDELFDACATGGYRIVLFAPGAPWEMTLEDVRRRPGIALITAGEGDSFGERLRDALRERAGD